MIDKLDVEGEDEFPGGWKIERSKEHMSSMR